jgi:hypothetical protein
MLYIPLDNIKTQNTSIVNISEDNVDYFTPTFYFTVKRFKFNITGQKVNYWHLVSGIVNFWQNKAI